MAVDRTKDWRPAPGGISIGHYQITAGTLGCLVRKEGQWLILSNNHVLANCNQASVGDPILQRAPHDGGVIPDQEIAKLSEFVEIKMAGLSSCSFSNATASIFNFLAKLLGRKTMLVPVSMAENLVDCAIAKPNREEDILNRILEDDGSLVKIEGEAEAEVGLAVKKSGRTTGTKHRQVSQINVSANINMGDGKSAIFTNQFAIEHPTDNPFSQGGDSGSAILSEDNKLVGLLFAGSDTMTLANRWSNVKKSLKLD